jgi:hypothetical protein
MDFFIINSPELLMFLFIAAACGGIKLGCEAMGGKGKRPV